MTQPLPYETPRGHDSTKVLVVDDDAGVRRLLTSLLRREGHRVSEAASAEEALGQIRREAFDLVFSDILMPGKSGLELLSELRSLQPLTPVVLITAHASAEMAAHAICCGAFEYLEKPLYGEQILGLVARAQHDRALREAQPCAEDVLSDEALPDALVGEGTTMARLFAIVRKVAKSQSTVLITGESGTGKELITHAIHELGERRRVPLVAVNCTAIPEGLLESELFGHVKGAFTGATQDRQGLFEQADGGTILLDEIGDMSLDLQAKLLRVLQDHQIRPVGSTQSKEVDTRIIAATHKDLESEVTQGNFRSDLYYRLNVLRIQIPPLRDRPEDIPALVRVFLRRHGGLSPRRFSQEAIELLQGYPWPGNARELENAVERVVVLSDSQMIEPVDLRLTGVLAEQQRTRPVGFADAALRGLTLQEVEQIYIEEMVSLCEGHPTEAARRLAIDRKTLSRRLTGSSAGHRAASV